MGHAECRPWVSVALAGGEMGYGFWAGFPRDTEPKMSVAMYSPTEIFSHNQAASECAAAASENTAACLLTAKS